MSCTEDISLKRWKVKPQLLHTHAHGWAISFLFHSPSCIEMCTKLPLKQNNSVMMTLWPVPNCPEVRIWKREVSVNIRAGLQGYSTKELCCQHPFFYRSKCPGHVIIDELQRLHYRSSTPYPHHPSHSELPSSTR